MSLKTNPTYAQLLSMKRRRYKSSQLETNRTRVPLLAWSINKKKQATRPHLSFCPFCCGRPRSLASPTAPPLFCPLPPSGACVSTSTISSDTSAEDRWAVAVTESLDTLPSVCACVRLCKVRALHLLRLGCFTEAKFVSRY